MQTTGTTSGVECRGGARGSLLKEFGTDPVEGSELVEQPATGSRQVAEVREVLPPERGHCEVGQKAEADEHCSVAAGFGEVTSADCPNQREHVSPDGR